MNNELSDILADAEGLQAILRARGATAFDVINLDLQGYYSEDNHSIVNAIVENRLLADDGVFLITYQRNRENEASKNLMMAEMFFLRFVDMLAAMKLDPKNSWETVRHRSLSLNQIMDYSPNKEAVRMRGCIGYLIIDQFLGLTDFINAANIYYSEQLGRQPNAVNPPNAIIGGQVICCYHSYLTGINVRVVTRTLESAGFHVSLRGNAKRGLIVAKK